MTGWRQQGWWLQLGILPIRAYQLMISPWTGFHCRYQPTCSAYGIEAIERHGLMRGIAYLALRLGRCHPWGSSGYDPVPQAGQRDRNDRHAGNGQAGNGQAGDCPAAMHNHPAASSGH